MSEFETLRNELQEVKGLLKKILKQDDQAKAEWVDADTACQMLNVKPSTLASYRHKRMIAFRSPRPYQYSVASIEKFLSKRTTQAI